MNRDTRNEKKSYKNRERIFGNGKNDAGDKFKFDVCVCMCVLRVPLRLLPFGAVLVRESHIHWYFATSSYHILSPVHRCNGKRPSFGRLDDMIVISLLDTRTQMCLSPQIWLPKLGIDDAKQPHQTVTR